MPQPLIFWKKAQFPDYDAFRGSFCLNLTGQCLLVYYASLVILVFFPPQVLVSIRVPCWR